MNAPIAAEPVQQSRITFDVPAGACDCHTHIHGDPSEFPMVQTRTYTPQPASPAAMADLHRSLGIQRVVIVTPSIYGTDNSATIVGLNARGKDARGVAVIGAQTSDKELDGLANLGFRGIRLNQATEGVNDPALALNQFHGAVNRARTRNMHVQLHTSLPMIQAMKAGLAASPVPVVIDHFGGAKPELGCEQPGFADLLDLVRSGVAYVKISVSGGPRTDYSGFKPLAQALIEANADRIIWGTNWPHPNSKGSTDFVTPHWRVDDGVVLNQLPSWAPTIELRTKILSDNPARLYGF